MAFHIYSHPEHVTRYLVEYEGLSRAVRILLAFSLHEFRENASACVEDPSLRLAPGSPYFRDTFWILDEAQNRLLEFRLTVNATGAAAGVLGIEFVDIDATPMG